VAVWGWAEEEVEEEELRRSGGKFNSSSSSSGSSGSIISIIIISSSPYLPPLTLRAPFSYPSCSFLSGKLEMTQQIRDATVPANVKTTFQRAYIRRQAEDDMEKQQRVSQRLVDVW
jgi:hypothetical protein